MATTLDMGYPQKVNQVSTTTAGGVAIGPLVAITNKASGGAIGTAAATVDIGSVFQVNQTTATQTLTLPTPTVTGDMKTIVVTNVGSQTFTMLSKSVTAGSSLIAIYTGSAWSTTV